MGCLTSAMLACFGILGCHTALAGSPVPEVERQKLESIAEKARERLNACFKKEGIAFSVRAESPLPSRSELESRWTTRQVVLGGTRSGVEFDFCAQTARITAFFHWWANEQCFGKKAPLYDQPTRPTWTEEKAKHVAHESIAALLGSFPNNLLVKKASYDHVFMESPKYYVGNWTVLYTRVDKAGHPFQNDGAVVNISEQYGPFSIGVQRDSKYAEPEAKLISHEEAIAKSDEFARRIAQLDIGKAWFQGYAFTGEKVGRLLIVNPNRILEAKDYDGIRAGQSRVARLAWEVRHKLVHKGPSTPGVTVPEKGEICVWIDAGKSVV